MKRLVLLAMLLGCSVPDDDNWEVVKGGIAAMPPSNLTWARRWAANRHTKEWFKLQGNDDWMTVICANAGSKLEPGRTEELYRVRTLLKCLNRWDAPLLSECIAEFVAETSARQDGGGSSRRLCEPWFHDGYEALDEDGASDRAHPLSFPTWEPEDETDEDLARDLVSSPTLPSWLPWAVVGGTLVLLSTGGAAAAFFPALCALSSGGPACPSNPAYPPGQTPQPGGDHP